uniref:DUF6533 domain-containing protein n=1 Tax=Mycena chlorophos TaxID=658473 RepID=A0ABQ0L0Y7_MYCCL|nr:predicted protein [Mycena chlorophos]
MPGPAQEAPLSDYPLSTAIPYVKSTYTSNNVNYAIATLLVYELLTSFDDEVAHVWPLKWRLPKILFFLNRYVIRIMLVGLWILADYPGTSPEFCRIYSYWQMIPLRLAILAAQALVVIRVWAIYNNSRPMFYVLSLLYGGEFLAVAASIVVATSDTVGEAQPSPLSCGLDSKSGYLLERYASATWLAPVAFEFIMILITLYKLVPRWSFRGRRLRTGSGTRSNGFIGSTPSSQAFFGGVLGSGGNVTVDILARDSFIYFLFIFTFSLINAILYEQNFHLDYHTILLGPTSAVSCIAVSRMMINIRSAPGVSVNQESDVVMSLSGTFLRNTTTQTNPGDGTGSKQGYGYGKYPYRTSNVGGSAPDLHVHDLAFAETYGGGGLGLGNLPPEPEPEEDLGSANPFLPHSRGMARMRYPPPLRKSTDGSTLVGSPPQSPLGPQTFPHAHSPPPISPGSPRRASISYFTGVEPVASSSSTQPQPHPLLPTTVDDPVPSAYAYTPPEGEMYVYESGYDAGSRLAKQRRERIKNGSRPGTGGSVATSVSVSGSVTGGGGGDSGG